MSVIDRTWTEMAAAALSAIDSFTASDEVFMLFGGAVLALQQDTVRAYAVDIAKSDDRAQAAAIDVAQPTPLGDFSARIEQAMQAMRAIERANDELFAHARRPDGLSADEHQVYLLMARMRATAARLWLLTLQARAVGEGGAGLRLGVAGLWTRLQTVPRDMLPERAVAFTGAFYAGIRSEPIDVSAWPFSP
jgi:hypothetical protein